MRRITIVLLFTMLIGGIHNYVSAQQDVPLHPTILGKGEFIGISPALRDLPAITGAEFAAMKVKAEKKALNKKLKPRSYPYEDIALPKGPDPVWQKNMGMTEQPKAPLVNFDGQTSPYYPPDCNGTAGPNHFMQTINSVYAIYNKSGALVAGPTNMNLLFSGVTGSSCNDGDPLILYDEQAGRWLAVEFSICGSNDYMLVAVSTTNDPTGTWYKYSFDVADMPDYEKFGIWQDGYYMGTNNSSGNDIYVFQRSVMLSGGASPQMVGFNNAWRPTTVDGFMCVPPVDNDGAFAPAGSPGLFITINDDAVAGGSDQLWIYELAVNWITPASSTFTRSQQLAVPSFDSHFGTSWDNIVQPNTQKLDAIPMVIMNVPQYRNFGSYQTLVCCHTVDVDATNHAGIRWYELRRTTGAWSVRQSGTYAPDAHHRWMGSIMLNGSSQIGLGYSISSSTVYPGIRYCGQSAGAYSSATGVLDIAEEVIQTGAYAQTSYNRWGDYSLMSVDPTDDKTFWFTTQYIGSGGTRKTRIASFKFGNSPSVITLAATSVTGTSATLNGTVNPNGLATTWYFEWGTTTNYGTQTTVTSAGSGTTSIAVNAAISGLIPGQAYHFRLVGVNSDGTTTGNDMTLTPGAATVTTTAATSITLSSAVTGGNVTSDGGSAITARGVCWGTSANPVVSGNHTTDGSGTGTFTSTLTGLSSNTIYHIRAYATNTAGTFYGTDLTFTTLCGIVSAFPWNEGFENGGSIPGCWSQQEVNSSGISWVFTTGSGNGNPAAAHGGTYNACLKDVTRADNKTRLITPTLNLTSVSNPQLKFWHTQAYWSPDQDLLTVFYKTSAGGTWIQLATYTANITAWTQETIALPGATSDYYIAFEGNAKWGWGVCVDDVQVSSSCTTTYPVSITIAASANPACQGTGVTFTATPANGGTTPVYQWKVNGVNAGTNNAAYIYAPVTGDQVSCILTSNATCTTGNPATSNIISMTVTPILAVGSISANQTICANAVPLELSGTIPQNGTSPVYQWQSSLNNTTFNNVNGATMLNYQPEMLSSTLYYRQLQNASGTCGGPLPTNTVTISVNPLLPVSVSVSPSANDICTGTSVTFTPAPVNGGTPTYQWFKNAVAVSTASTYSCVPVNGDQVYVIMTSSLTCKTGSPATSNTVTMTVNPLLPVSVSISPSANDICEGASVTFTPDMVNGGTPTYQWFKNAVAVSTASTYSCVPVNGDQVYVIMTSSLTCNSGSPATSNTVTMTINPLLPVSVSISPSANDICEGASVTFTPEMVNGGTPAYQWFKNSELVGTGGTYSCIPSNGDQVYVIMTSSLTCNSGSPATSNTVTMIVNPLLPVSVSILPSANNICEGASVTFTPDPVNGGTPSYQWFKNSEPVGTSGTYSCIPENNDQLHVVMTSDLTCNTGSPATSNTVTMMVNPLLPVSVTIEASENPVDKGTPVTYTASAVNGGASPVYQWLVNGSDAGTNNDLFTYVPFDGDVVSCMFTSSETCTSSNPAYSSAIIMVVNAVPATLDLQNLTVSGAECYDALQTISVAGNGTFFSVPPGDSATMIAGWNILYYPGTVVSPGGYLYGYIAPEGPWCVAPPVPAVLTGTTELILQQDPQHYRVYPNPTTGSFMLEMKALNTDEQCLVEIYDMKGKKILSDEWAGKHKREFSLSGQPIGIYLIRVISERISGTTRIIKQI